MSDISKSIEINTNIGGIEIPREENQERKDHARHIMPENNVEAPVSDNKKTLEKVIDEVRVNMPEKYSAHLQKSDAKKSHANEPHITVGMGNILNLYNELMNTDKSSDSFAMSMIKKSLIKLSTLYSDDKNTDKEYLAKRAREVSALLFACENYRRSRFSDDTPKNERHEIVAQLIIEADTFLNNESDDIIDRMASVDFSNPREAMYDLVGSYGMSGMLSSLNEIDNLISEKQPEDQAAFTRQKSIILVKYSDLIEKLKEHTADTRRITKNTQKKYRIIADTLVSLSAERARILNADFNDFDKKNKKGRKSWKNLFVTEDAKSALKKAPMLYSAIGGDFYLKEDDTSHKSIAEITEIAKSTGTEICYCEKTLFDLTSIQIIDSIAGIKNRSTDTLAFRYRRKKTGGRYILELYDVKVKSTVGFGKRDKIGLLPDSYDYAFVDKFMKLTPNALIKSMQKNGYAADSAEKEALIKRFTKVKDILNNDRKNSPRTRQLMMDNIKMDAFGNFPLIDHSFVGEGYTTESTRKMRLELKGVIEKDESEVNLTENELFAKTLNAKADEISTSGRLRMRRKEHIAQKVNEILSGDISKSVRRVCENILSYTRLNPTASDIMKNTYKKMFIDMETVTRDAQMHDVAWLFDEEENSMSDPGDIAEKQNIPTLAVGMDEMQIAEKQNIPTWAVGMDEMQREKLMVFNLVSDLQKGRQELLDNKANIPPQMRAKDLDAINTLLGLFSFSKGNLDVEHIPENAKRINDTGITYKFKDETLQMVDQKWVPLFEHEPCLEDVAQGYLGDCYFLGCISAIVEKNPTFIKEMMHDDGDTVTVRLYDPDKNPVYITMEKKLPAPSANGEDRFARGSFWVMYLEKAITLMKINTIEAKSWIVDFEKKLKESFTPNARYYDYVGAGGWASEILPIITGMDTEEYNISSGFNTKSANLTDEEIRNTRGNDVDRVISFLENAVSLGKAITASTGVINPVSLKGGLNSEIMGHGIVGTHQYAILGVEEIAGKKMVKLRNTWGTGRIRYGVQKGSDVLIQRWGDNADPGAFYLTPERFVAYFHRINTVDMRQDTVEDAEAYDGDIAYGFTEDDRAKKTLRLHGYNKKKETSEFDLEKWDDTLKTYVNTQKKGVEKKKYHLFFDALEGKKDGIKKAGIDPKNIRLFSSIGDVYYSDRNENVLQFDLAGTGEDVFTRGTDLRMRAGSADYDTRFESHYGQKVEGFENVRKKEKNPMNGGPIKTRYNFGGATFLNGGENNMQDAEKRIETLGREWLKPILDEMINDVSKRKPTHVLFNGFSRGASAEGAGLMRLSNWMHANYDEDILQYVQFEIVYIDSTPGFGSRSGIYDKAEINSDKCYDKNGKETSDEKKMVYRGMSKNLSSTAIYSLKSGMRAFLDPQKVIGADRVIISPFSHNNIDSLDNVVDDTQTVHRRPFIDPITGCAYRGSGINALPKGFYFADANNFLIRVDSYADFKNLIEKLLAGLTRDGLRTSVIDEVAREYFKAKQ